MPPLTTKQKQQLELPVTSICQIPGGKEESHVFTF
jgi:hypothetical protein